VLRLGTGDGIVPYWRGILENWADYCRIKWCSCYGGTPALLSCLRKYSRLLAVDAMVLM